MFARRSSEPRSTSPSEDARRTQRTNAEELRAEADRNGIDWDHLVKKAGLGKSGKWRLNNGQAGAETIGRVRRVMETLIPKDGGTRLPPTDSATRRQPAPRRWVVVQRKDRQLFLGITEADDDDIAVTGRVRLQQCHPIKSPHADAAMLASVGPSGKGIVGPEAPGALILEVAVVFDCSRAAVKRFEEFGSPE